MRITRVLASISLIVPLILAACGGGDDAEPFDTLQACYDEHHNEESLPVQDAIVVCCLDHPIAGVHPSCKDTQADCVAHVDTELDPSVGSADIQAACTEYITEK
jgi:hypothetical protein